uniref:omega-amidase n=1 Tax=Nyssomyia neivai TaxID=330878 RepID=A0A1L8E2M2_9DIPT
MIRVILVQNKVGDSTEDNVDRAMNMIRQAVIKEERTTKPILAILSECFNSPYGVKFFNKYAELIPEGYTSKALSAVAKELGIYIIGGSYPERDYQNPKIIYNTCTVWGPNGELIATYRKIHVTLTESAVLTPGDKFTVINIGPARIGIGICYDIQFDELSLIYRNAGCNLLVFPAIFCLTRGPLTWELYQRSRANDTQTFVTMVSNARDHANDYVAWGHTMLVDPWGQVVKSLKEEEDVIVTDIDFSVIDKVKEEIPINRQRRTDLYEVVAKVPIE